MREIKFRIYDLQSKIMSDHFTLDDYASDHDSEDGYFRYQLRNNDKPYNDNIIMQFTGLHDKNGKEIYEGDVVKHYNGVNPVTWETGLASFQMSFSNFVLDQEIIPDYSECEVIGNIYENPELLNEK